MIVIVMGVSGAGKTRIGELLAERLGCSFIDGDTFHSAANKEKMARGTPLTDTDRWPWLDAIRAAIEAKQRAGEWAVFGCSSLKRAYRDVLRGSGSTNDVCGGDRADEVRFVYLKGSFDVLSARLGGRTGHFFDASLLQSQLDTLEEPGDDEAVTVSIELAPETIVDRVAASLNQA